MSVRNFYILIIHLLLTLGAFFMVNVEMPPWSGVVSGFSIVFFLIPSLFAAFSWLGKRNALLLFGILGLYALLIETVALISGFPYGHFSYSDLLGFRLFGVVPWTVAFAWTPLMLAAYGVVALTIENRLVRIFAIALLLVIFDLVLDPGAVLMGFWTYEQPGVYYDVPWSNFGGWIVSGILGAVIVESVVYKFRPLLPVPVQILQSGYLTIFFWTAIAFFGALYLPAIIGVLLLFILLTIYNRHHYDFDDMIVLVDEENTPIGTAPKLPTHTSQTPLHRAFSIFIFNSRGELLLQRRAADKKTWGGVWSNSCCGHVKIHETVLNAAKRRLKYELRVKAKDLTIILPDFRYCAEKDGVVENEFCPVLVGIIVGDPNPNPTEVDSVKWVAWNEFLSNVKMPNNGFSPWAIEETLLLDESLVFKEFYTKHVRN